MKKVVRSKLLVFVVVLGAIGCQNLNRNHEILSSFQLDYTDPNQSLFSNIVSDQKFVLLENIEESSFTQIDKAIFRNDLIYILDVSGQYCVYVFRNNGSFVRKVGNRGTGPGEYNYLCDFDVSDDGTIYLYDRQKMRMFIHGNDGELLKVLNLPFRADAFTKIKHGYLFSLAFDNEKENLEGIKVLATDDNLKTLKKYLNYNKDFQDDKGDVGLFVRTNLGILYNKPVNDTVYVFDDDGEIKNSLVLDFGKRSVPSVLANNFGDVMAATREKGLRYIYRSPFVVKGHFLASIMQSSGPGIIHYDLIKKVAFIDTVDIKTYSHRSINYPVGIIGDSIVVSPMESQTYSLDVDWNKLENSVRKHIQGGGYVLILNKIKN